MQSFLMGLLCYFTFWIDVSDFQDRFMGSLTCLLVLSTLMGSLASSLPKTSYYKVLPISNDLSMSLLLCSTCNIGHFGPTLYFGNK